MNEVKRSILLVGILLIMGCHLGFAQNKEERKLIEQEVTILGDKFSDFMIAGNVDSLIVYFSPNCHFLMEFEPLFEKREEVEKYYKSYFKKGAKLIEYSLKREEMKVYGELVLEIGTLEVKHSNDGVSTNVMYNYSFLWKESKSKGYRIRSAMWNLPESPCK